jgi:hypothetical protein
MKERTVSRESGGSSFAFEQADRRGVKVRRAVDQRAVEIEDQDRFHAAFHLIEQPIEGI